MSYKPIDTNSEYSDGTPEQIIIKINDIKPYKKIWSKNSKRPEVKVLSNLHKLWLKYSNFI